MATGGSESLNHLAGIQLRQYFLWSMTESAISHGVDMVAITALIVDSLILSCHRRRRTRMV